MRRSALVAAALGLLATGCPERATPQRGTALTFQKPADARDLRPVVDRRLAQLAFKASLHEDARTLTVRVPEGGDLATVKALLSRRARLAFCEVDERAATQWCADPSRPAADPAPPAGCAVPGPGSAALADAGVQVVLEQARTAWPVLRPCLEPTLVAAAHQSSRAAPGQVIQVQLDRASTDDFGALTQRLVGHRLLIVLDDAVLVAPVVQDAITSGKAMLWLERESLTSARLLAAALAGGTLPSLELVSEKPYGPPSLR